MMTKKDDGGVPPNWDVVTPAEQSKHPALVAQRHAPPTTPEKTPEYYRDAYRQFRAKGGFDDVLGQA